MSEKRNKSRPKPVIPESIRLHYRDADTPFGITRKTALKLAKTLGLTETEVIHAALAHFARQHLPHLEDDTDLLTPEQKLTIRKLQPSGRMTVKESLF